MKIQLEVKNLDSLLSKYKDAEGIINDELNDALKRMLVNLEGKSKDFAPVVTGTLRRSIHTEGPNSSGKNVSGIVGTDIVYAPFVERGTRYFIGRFYFARALQATESIIRSLFSDALKRINDRLAF